MSYLKREIGELVFHLKDINLSKRFIIWISFYTWYIDALSQQWKYVTLNWLPWSRGLQWSHIWVTATAHLYVPPKGTGLPRNPQEASQWYITIQKQLNRGCSQIQSKWQTLLQRVWQLCWTGDRTIHLSCNGNAVQLSSWRRPRNWVRACTEGPWSWLGLQASFFQCWLLSRDSCLLPSLRCAEEGDRRARHERQVTGQLVSSSGPYNWPALTEVL